MAGTYKNSTPVEQVMLFSNAELRKKVAELKKAEADKKKKEGK